MPRRFRPTTAAAAAFAFLLLGASTVSAQDLKDKTIRVVVPFPAGGTADNIVRQVAQQAGLNGYKMVVENRPGGGTIIATEQVARATPDGTSILIMSNSFVINTIVRKQLLYDPFAMEPLCFVADSPQVIVVNEAAPYRTLKEFVDDARARPGALSFAAVGPATTQHIAGEMFKRDANINLTYVPFAGGGPATNALLGQHVNSVLANYNEVMEQLKAGKLRALAVASRQRLKELPDVPTFIESGYKDFETSAFFGLVTTAKTPVETIGKLKAMLADVLKAPAVTDNLRAQGLDVVGTCGDELRAQIKRQQEKYTGVIKDAGIKVE